MEPPVGYNAPRYDHSHFYAAAAAELADIPENDSSTRTLLNLVEFAEPLAAPEPEPKRQEADKIKRCPASADLSSIVDHVRNESLRESKSVDEILQHLRSNQFAQAIEIYQSLFIPHFKNIAFKTISNKLFESEQIALFINALLKDLPLDKRDEKIFEMASEHIELSRGLIKAKQERFNVQELEGFKSAFRDTAFIAEKAIRNTVNLYKLLTHDSLRCALIKRLYASIFLFREIPIPKFPIEDLLKAGVTDKKDLEKERRSFQDNLFLFIKKCETFMTDSISSAKSHIENELLNFHLKSGNEASLIFFFKNTCQSHTRIHLQLFALDRHIQ
ncbi:MAG: hypothetical protein ACK4HV_09420, partial [Parachlamydiaceae bacterium]